MEVSSHPGYVSMDHEDAYTYARNFRVHVFGDLQPYMCTAEMCSSPKTLFRSATEWYRHEKTHYSEGVNAGLSCPLCPSLYQDGKVDSLYQHLARHLREIALYILPAPVNDADEDHPSTSSNTGDDEEASQNSFNPRNRMASYAAHEEKQQTQKYDKSNSEQASIRSVRTTSSHSSLASVHSIGTISSTRAVYNEPSTVPPHKSHDHRFPSPRVHQYSSSHSITGTASVTHRGTTSVWNHHTSVRETQAPKSSDKQGHTR